MIRRMASLAVTYPELGRYEEAEKIRVEVISRRLTGGQVLLRRHSLVGKHCSSAQADTIDGGASMWLRCPNADGSPAHRWTRDRGTSEELDLGLLPPASLARADHMMGPDEIPLRCHCSGVDLVLRRGDADFRAGEELPWFIDPATHKSISQL